MNIPGNTRGGRASDKFCTLERHLPLFGRWLTLGRKEIPRPLGREQKCRQGPAYSRCSMQPGGEAVLDCKVLAGSHVVAQGAHVPPWARKRRRPAVPRPSAARCAWVVSASQTPVRINPRTGRTTAALKPGLASTRLEGRAFLRGPQRSIWPTRLLTPGRSPGT